MLQDKRVPALLAYFRFFVIEPNSARAEQNLGSVQRLLGRGVEVNGKNNVTISISPNMLGDTLPDGSHKPNDFGTIDLILSMTAAMDNEKLFKKDSEREKFLRKLNTICGGLDEAEKTSDGFYWEYYAPYFIAMQKAEMIETFSYIAFATADDPETDKWIKANEEKIEAFYKWSSEFKWLE